MCCEVVFSSVVMEHAKFSSMDLCSWQIHGVVFAGLCALVFNI